MPKLNIHNRTGIKLQIKAGLRKGAQFDGDPKVLDVNDNQYVVYSYSDDFLVTAAPKMKNTPDANIFAVLSERIDLHGLAFRDAAAIA